MNINRAQLIAGASIFLSALGVAYASGHAEATPEVVDVQVIYEENGEIDSLTVYTDGKPVQSTTHTAWRDNPGGATGLSYDEPTN